MQSFNTLNAYGSLPVDYNSFRSYEIVFGNNLGNTSVTEYQGGAFLIPRQVPLVTFNNPSRDLLINLNISPANAVTSVQYVGSNPGVAVYPANVGNYSITGIKIQPNYNEVFDNLYVDTPDTSLTPFAITTVVDDQLGNTRTWTTNVTLIVNPGFSITGNLTYNEDQIANINNVTIQDPVTPNTEVYNITLSTANANVGLIQYGSNTASSSVTVSLAKSAVNAAFSTNQFKFVPAADYTSNAVVQYFQQRTSDSRAWFGNINLNIGTTHNEYTVPANVTYNENQLANITGISITDTRPNNINPNIQYTSTLATGNSQIGYLRYLGTDYTTLTLGPNTKANINSALGNVKWVPALEYTGNSNTTLTYSQLQVTDNKQQALNVPIRVQLGNLAPANYSTPGSNVYFTQGTAGNALTGLQVTDISDQIQPTTYTVTVAAQNPNNIRVDYLGNVANSHTFTGNRTTVNAALANVRPMPVTDFLANDGLYYTQVRNWDNATQAANVGITVYGMATNLSRTTKTFQGKISSKVLENIGLQNQGFTGAVYSVYINSPGGAFRYAGDPPGSANSVFSIANTTMIGISTALNNDVVFTPYVTSNTTFTIRVERSGSNVINYTGNLTFTGNATYNRISTYTSESSAMALSYDELTFGNVQVLLVAAGGGGGGGSPPYFGSTGAGGGGGGGGVKTVQLTPATGNIVPGTFQLYIGRGGPGGNGAANAVTISNGTSGGNTILYAPNGSQIDQSLGGSGGLRSTSLGTGGTGGTPNGGRGGNSWSPTGNVGLAGVYSTISGSNIGYGGGGGGGAVASTGATGGNGFATSGGKGGSFNTNGNTFVAATNGANGGGGGGGAPVGFYNGGNGGNGANGVVILKVS